MNRTILLDHYHPRWLGAHLECHGVMPSTNDRARQLLEECGPEAHGAVILAEGQSAGRGRHGRTWESPPGLCLALSVALWADSPSEGLPLLPLAGSLAVTRALKKAAALEAALKWPNDVLCRDGKLAGALLEARWHGEELAGLVLGIGVNLNQDREDFPPELRASSTSILIETGSPVVEEPFAASLLSELEPLLEASLQDPGFLVEACAPHWVHRAGDLLEVSGSGGSHRGSFVEVAGDGSLALDEGGRKVTILYGEVQCLRSAP